ncbi:MAG: zinc-ribbon domain-containing protein [Thermodesulfobacteriota bacterium]|nr:zinc-ribbon domain-containing protein [Deltaproteobacteria bacterium]MDI6755349.1 zinc-ribbon domain-containing protein [Thermodesulfobacteriota bacterium]
MKCPHCGKSLGDKVCPSCGSEVLEESSFCHRCGAPWRATETVSPEEVSTDISQRILCSDGACIGVVNDQGICKVCGKPYTG